MPTRGFGALPLTRSRSIGRTAIELPQALSHGTSETGGMEGAALPAREPRSSLEVLARAVSPLPDFIRLSRASRRPACGGAGRA